MHKICTKQFGFKRSEKLQERPEPGNESCCYKWQDSKKADFINNIDQAKLEEIRNNLQNAVNQQSVNMELINYIASEMSSLFLSSASNCFKKSNISNAKKNDKPWFGYKCRNSRRKYLSARKAYNVRPTHTNKTHLTNMSKSYKKILNFYINNHKNKTQNKLRNLHSGQSKQFWKFLKCAIDLMLPVYADYFNIILNTGILTDSWLKTIICPLYKRFGSPNPENYRPITLVSCFSKLFSSILNSRLNTYLEEFKFRF